MGKGSGLEAPLRPYQIQLEDQLIPSVLEDVTERTLDVLKDNLLALTPAGVMATDFMSPHDITHPILLFGGVKVSRCKCGNPYA